MERKPRDLTVKEKVDILNRYDKLPKMSQRNAAVQLKVSQPLLCKIMKISKKKCTLNENLNCKRNRDGKDKEVESALKLWFTNVRERDAHVNGPILRQKAEDLAAKLGKGNFVATEGWFHRWKGAEHTFLKDTW
ncbi:tigger transposable element-derived protein 3-like [Parasteatoda tepidariorum]|uniref:tigger transposable element-derived protein 3-like n=1 Tax=Parasteatoda tepidariorum TaxID=114398 RepID=UPI0039BCDD76